MNKKHSLICLPVFLLAGWFCMSPPENEGAGYITYEVDVRQQDFQLFYKDEKGQRFQNFEKLRSWLDRKGKRLVFAMNGGMYRPDNSPQGLFIQNQGVVMPLDTASGSGNFYLKPNGVFYITNDRQAAVKTTEDVAINRSIKYATQSGPMLVINGDIHPAFKESSSHKNTRNGVGIRPNGDAVFAMSKGEVSLYEFAQYFKRLGCRNALYLDGFVSRSYLPQKQWVQTDGNFGVIIAVVENK